MVDDFTTQALIDCQIAAITEPDRVLVVSDLWRRKLLEDLGVEATVVTNGVRTDRFSSAANNRTISDELRRRVGADGRHLCLTVGGIEPRKGSKYLMEAMADVKRWAGPDRSPVLAVVGGHSFQDYSQYQEDVLGSLDELGLRLDTDVVLLGTVDDQELPAWFHAADSFVFPSLNEGWGLVVLEAQAAGLPVVVPDIDVFGEFLTPDVDAVFTEAGNSASLADGVRRVISDDDLATRLAAAGPASAARFSWAASAAAHAELYQAFLGRTLTRR